MLGLGLVGMGWDGLGLVGMGWGWGWGRVRSAKVGIFIDTHALLHLARIPLRIIVYPDRVVHMHLVANICMRREVARADDLDVRAIVPTMQVQFHCGVCATQHLLSHEAQSAAHGRGEVCVSPVEPLSGVTNLRA